jgi:uncharacterized protein involved in outer membrane biogenesis
VPGPVRIGLYLFALVFAILFAIWLTLYITKGRFLRPTFESVATRTLHRDVKVGGDFQLYFDPLDAKFRAERMTISNPDWARNKTLFSADAIEARIKTLALLLGRQRVRVLTLDNSTVDLEWTKDGKHNSWTMGDPNVPPSKLHLPYIRSAFVSGTTVHYSDPRLLLTTDVKVDTVEATNNRLDNDIRFHGGGTMRAEPFVVTGRLLSPNETVTGGENRVALAIASGPTHLDVTGTLPAATRIAGANLALQARGPNLARLFDFLGVAVPATRSYHIRSALTYEDGIEGGAWKFTHMRGVFGDSDLAGRMTITLPKDRLNIDADLATQKLDILDIGPFVGYEPQALKNKGVVAATSQPGGHPRLLPDAPLRIDAVSRFDAHVKYRARTIRAPNVPISNVGLVLNLDHSRLALSPLTFDMAGGLFSSDVVINARKQPVETRYDIRLSPTPMGRLLARWGVEQSGTSGTLKARAQMTGEGDSVRKSLASANGRFAVIIPNGTMWARNAQLAELDIGTFLWKMFEKKLKEPVQINCGLLAFTVRDGIAAADPILIDTSKNVIVGRGGFSFKNESVDLLIRADGKTFSLISAQSPVNLGGYFAKPSLNVISPELIARGGAAVALGVFASPLASVLAFVDIGDAKAAACGPVLQGAHAIAQRTTKGKPRTDVGRGTTSKAKNGRSSPAETRAQQQRFRAL